MASFGITGHSSADASDQGEILWIKITTDANAYTVNASNGGQTWNQGIGDGAGRFQMAIYADSGGNPTGSALCSSADTIGVSNGSTAGTNVSNAQLSGCGTLAANTSYWIGRNQNEASVEPGFNGTTGCTSATSGFTASTYGTWPTNPSRTTSTACWTLSINVTASGGATRALFAPTSLSGLGAGGSFFHDRTSN